MAILHMADVDIKIATRKVAKQRIRYLTAEEWERLDAELPPHLQPMARFAIATGLRQSNVTQLKWDQVDMDRRVAWIHPDEAKAEKAIGVPLSDMAITVLQGQKILRDNEIALAKEEGRKYDPAFVFTYKRKPIAKIKTAWTKALARAEIEHFRWHDLRHTWASWHVMSGTPLEVLKELGGWSDYKMVLRYAHLAPDHLAGFAGNAKPYKRAA
jgi:integrase